MSDLIALVLVVRPQQQTSLPGYLGQAVYAQALRWLDNYSPSLAQEVHDSSTPKPITCSTLLGGKRVAENGQMVYPNQTYRVRLTALREDIAAIMAGWLTKPPKAMDLDDHSFLVERVICDPAEDAWSGRSSYQDLAAPYLLARQIAGGRSTLHFVSATTFRSGGMVLPLPLPPLVFGSLADRWNAFSPVGLSPEMRQFCESEVSLSHYELRSRSLPYKEVRYLIGCIGQATYVALNNDKYWRGVLRILSDYAFYSGVGYRTTIGMGQVRPSFESKPKTVP